MILAVHPRRSSRRRLRCSRTCAGSGPGGTGRGIRSGAGADRDSQQQPGDRQELQHPRRGSARCRSLCSGCSSGRGTLGRGTPRRGTSRLRRGSLCSLRHPRRCTCRVYRLLRAHYIVIRISRTDRTTYPNSDFHRQIDGLTDVKFV